MRAYRRPKPVRAVVAPADSLTIGLRLIRRRRLADGCMLDSLWEMARLPGGGLDLPALRASVAAIFPEATPLQITRALTFATDQLARRPAVGAKVHRLSDGVQLDLFARRAA